jgi:hypothetical protein
MAARNVAQIATYVTPDERRAIKLAAHLADVTMARWIRTAVREKLKLKGEQNGKGA